MRSIVSTGNDGRPPLDPVPLAANGSIRLTNSVHGTTRFISSRNTRLRVLLVTSSNPVVARLICFINVVSPNQSSACWVLQTFLSLSRDQFLQVDDQHACSPN